MNVFEQGFMILRLLVAALCGGLIGFERKNRAKEAGIRTHLVVACASALMMIISKYGFLDLHEGLKSVDSARLAAQVVSGVGFLGAGMIFVQKNSIRGLTTAAGIWATAGIGMAIGSGMYLLGIITTLIIILAQVFLHGQSSWLMAHVTKTIAVYGVKEDGYRQRTIMMLKSMKINVTDVTVKRRYETGEYDYVFTIEAPSGFDEDVIISKFDYDVKIGNSL